MKTSGVKKTLLSVLAIVMVFMLLAGCGNSSNKTSTGKSAKNNTTSKSKQDNTSGTKVKGQLSVLVEGGSPAYKVAKATANEFTKKTGYAIKLDAVPYSGVYSKLNADIQAKSGSYDVATIDVVWLPALYHGFSPLNDVLSKKEKEDLLPGLLSGSTINGKTYGIPSWDNAQILYYRKDWFADPKNKSAFKKKYGYELQPPKTWKQYRDTSKFFTKNGVYGTGIYGGNNGTTVTNWLALATQAGAKPLIVDTKGNVLVNQKPYVEALQFMTDIFRKDKSSPPDTLSMGSSEISNLFTSGKAAMILAWGHYYHKLEKKLPGKVGVAPMIAGSAGIGAIPGPWYQVVLKSSKKQKIAKKYLEFLYKKNYLYMDNLGVAARKSIFNDYLKKGNNENLKALMDTLAAPQTQNRPNIAQFTQIENEALLPAVQNALSGKMTPQAALNKAATQIKKILKQ